MHGIGEKFSSDLFTGTGNYSIPIEVPAGRNGFQPQLSLVYSTGNGNSAFGLGWSLSVPGVARNTSKGVPTYDDSADVFVLSGSEDLVAVGGDAAVTRYRPRTETSFSRIEHHHDAGAKTNYWEVRSRDGTVSRYGSEPAPAASWTDPAVVADPQDTERRHAWKLTETRDPFGNQVRFDYIRDSVREDGPHRWDQVYLSQIRYVDYGNTANPDFLVHVRFHYEDRPDPFSEYRSGFEVRTIKRCKRIEIWTNATVQQRVRTYHLTYRDELASPVDQLPHNGASLLAEVRVEGHDDANGASQSLPPLRLSYGAFTPGERTFEAITGPELPPASLGDPNYELVDLFGNGLPDVMEMSGGLVRYWRNLGQGRFDRPRSMSDAPAGLSLADPGVQLIDADGDGRADLVVTQPGLSGYYPLTFHGGWDRRSFRRWDVAPSFSLEDPEAKLVDLDGDGVTDLLRSGTRFECYFNDATRGWHATRRVERRRLEHFPNVSFSDARVKWADMTGDGLTDIVLVHDGRVDYWPSLGRGDFAPRITMRKSPRLPYGYDPRRLLVGDVDGDGVADLVYVDDHKVTLWINQGGNAWSEPIEILGTPAVTDLDSVRLTDLLGTGVSGLLWSRDAATAPRERMFFLDFVGAHKPYLLERIDNSMGAVTNIGYAPSTRYYLQDVGTAREWQTPLPFPVQVVARVESVDQISGGKLTTEYTYHHGYWDGAEREFRGFGRVDQRDSEAFDEYHGLGLDRAGRTFTSVEARFFAPPTETRSWFCLGPVGEEFGDWSEVDYSHEFWSGDAPSLARPADVIAALDSLPNRRARRDALRTLRGRVLRTELYARDGTERAGRPYTVTEQLHGLRTERPPQAGSSERGVFFPFLIAERTTQWERGDDPMTQLAFTGDHDPYGQPSLQLSLAVPRARDFRQQANQGASPFLATYTVTSRAQRDDASAYIVDRTANQTTFELVDDGRLAGTTASPRPSALDVWNVVLGWKLSTSSAPRHQAIGQSLHHYDGNDFEGLPVGQIGTQGALKRVEELVLTEAGLHDGYRTGSTVASPPEEPPYLDRTGAPTWTADYPTEFQAAASRMQHSPPAGTPVVGGYVFHGGDSVRLRGFFAATTQRAYNARGLVVAERDALGHETTIGYGDGYDLLPTKVTDPQSLETTAAYNYRVLQPELVADPNANDTAYAYTPLGLLDSVAVLGKPGVNEGDTRAVPGTTFTYAFDAFRNSGQPVHTHTVRRTHHVTDPADTGEVIETREFSDGFGRLLQTRTIAEDVLFGSAEFGDAGLPLDQAQTGTPVARVRPTGAPPNVVVSGWQTFDNKGRVVEKYEPFFSEGWDYRPATQAQRGQKATLHYDSRGRVVRTVNPDGSEQLTLFGVPFDITDPSDFGPSPWESYAYDANDNAGRTHAGDASIAKYASHFNTPTSMVVDALGRTVEQVERNGATSSTDWYTTRHEFDIRGNLLKVWDQLGRLAFQHVYDLSDRQLRSEQLDSGVRRVAYDAAGDVMEQRDAKGSLTLRVSDKLRRPTHLWARDGGSESVTLRERISYGDDSASSGLSTGQAAAKNLLGKPHKHHDEAGRLAFEEYDFKGNVVEKTRRVINDAQILSAFTAAPASNWQVTPYRVNWQPPAGSTLDTHASTLLDGATYRTSQSFDALSRVKRVDYPADVSGSRKRLVPSYNAAGALERVVFDGQLFVEHIAYNAKGQRTLIAYGDRDPAKPGPRVMTRYAYDSATFRLARMRTERYSSSSPYSFSANGGVLQDVVHEYDLAGNLVAIRDRAPGSGTPASPDALDRAFTYDPLYRLLSATGRECDTPLPNPWDRSPRCHDVTRTRPYIQVYSYDSAGNMERLEHHLSGGGTMPTRHYDLVPNTNRLSGLRVGTTAAPFKYRHDAAGNMIQENTERHLEWDHADRLRVFRVQPAGSEPSQHAHYLYDAGGQRVKKLLRKQGGRVEVTVYLDGVFEHDATTVGATRHEHTTLHVMDDESRIGTIRVGHDPDDSTPAIKFHLGDHLGSSAVVVDQAGSWVNREEYTPYGETSFGSFAKKRYRFTGKERDGESGLSYHGARYYASWLARWTATDPAGSVDGSNLYAFARNRPLILRDPSGLQAEELESLFLVDEGANTLPPSPPSEMPPSMKERLDVTESRDPLGQLTSRTVRIKGADNMFVPWGPPHVCKSLADRVMDNSGVDPQKDLLNQGFPVDPNNAQSGYTWPAMRVFERAIGANQSDVQYNATKAKEAVDYIAYRINEGTPVLIGVNEGGVSQSINEGVTDHWLNVVGYKMEFDSQGRFRVTELHGLDNAVTSLNDARARPVFSVNDTFEARKAATGAASNQAADRAYQLTQIRVYREDFEVVRKLDSWYDRRVLAP